MHQEGGQRATTILTRRPGHCGRPAPELRSVAQLPKVFIDGLDEHGIAEAKPPYKTFGALMEQAMRWTRSGWDSSGLCRFEAEILQSGARPVCSRHRSMASSRAQATTAFFRVAPRAVAWRPKTCGNFLNPRQAGFHFLKRQTASTSNVRMRRLPSRSILPSFCLVPVLNSLGQQPM